MIALPPSFAGALNATMICVLPAVIVGCAGAFGTVAGTTEAEAGDGGLVPTPLVAVTVHVYVLPFVRPITVSGEPGPDAEWPGIDLCV